MIFSRKMDCYILLVTLPHSFLGSRFSKKIFTSICCYLLIKPLYQPWKSIMMSWKTKNGKISSYQFVYYQSLMLLRSLFYMSSIVFKLVLWKDYGITLIDSLTFVIVARNLMMLRLYLIVSLQLLFVLFKVNISTSTPTPLKHLFQLRILRNL